MGNETAGLTISIDSTSAVGAKDNLDRLTGAGERTEQAARKAGRAWVDTVERIAASTSSSAARLDSLNSTQTRMLAVVERVAASMDKLTAAYARNVGQSATVQQTADKVAEGLSRIDRQSGAASQSMSRASKEAGSMGSAFLSLSGYVKLATASFLGFSAAGLVKESAMLAARFETMGVVMGVAGNNAGRTRAEMAALEGELQKTGISMIGAREVLTTLATANMDLANATKLARLAQDLAVVGNINSTEALERLVQGLRSGEIEILRTLGLNVNFENSYQKLAATLGVSQEALSEQQKMAARTSATFDEGARYAGIYAEAMGTAGKQVGSLTRLWEDLKTSAGGAFLPTLTESVQDLTEALKLANAELAIAGSEGTVDSIGSGLAAAFKVVYQAVTVLGANVLYVFSAIGKEIVGIAKQAKALGTFDFDGASKIRADLIADAERSRAALDAFEKRIMEGAPKTPAASRAAAPAMSEADRIAGGEASRKAAEQDAARAAWSKIVTANMSDQAKLVQQIADIEAAGLKAGKSRKEIEEQIAAARTKAAGKGGGVSAVDYSAQTLAIDLAARAERDILQRANRDNEYQYEVGLKTAVAYYTDKASIEAQGNFAAANAASAELAIVEKLIASGKGTAAERKKLLDQKVKLTDEASRATLAAFEAEQRGLEELEKYWLGFQKGWTEAAEKGASSAWEQADALRDQVAQYGMSKSAIADTVAARAREEEALARTRLAMAVMKGARQEEIVLIEREADALGRRAAALEDQASSTRTAERQDEYAKFADEAKRQNEQVGDSLTDALLRGFEDGYGFAENFVRTLRNMFATLVLKPVIQPVAQGAANIVTGALGLASSGGGTGWSQAGGALSAIGNTFTGGTGSLFSALGTSSLLGGTSFGAGLQYVGANGLLGGLGSAGTFLGAGQFGLAAGAALPAIGTALGAISMLSSLFDGGEKRSGGSYGWTSAAGTQFLHGPSGGTGGNDALVRTAIDATAAAVSERYAAIGSETIVQALRAGFETSDKGRGGVMAGLQTQDGLWIGQDGSGSNYAGTYYSDAFSQSPDMETAVANLQTILGQIQLQALQADAATPAALRAVVGNDDISALSADAVTQRLAAVDAQITAVTQLRTALESLPFPNLQRLSYDAAAGLIEAAGGFDALNANITTFYSDYYSEQERAALSLQQMTTAAADLGVALPTSLDAFQAMAVQMGDSGKAADQVRAQFRALVEGQDATTESGQRVTAGLLEIAGAFSEWLNYAQTTADGILNATPSTGALEKFQTQLANVQTAAQRASSALSQRNAAGSVLDNIDKALGRTGTAAAAREQQLWAAMQSASLEQQVDLAGQLSQLVLERYQTEKASLEELIDLGKSLQTYVDSLLTSDLSPLTLGQQLAEAATQYQDKLAAAQGGDKEALAALQGVSQTYLQLAQRYYASGDAYTGIFNGVTGALDALGASTQTQAEQQLQVGTESLAQLEQLRGIAANAYSALDRQYQQAVAATQAEMAGLEQIALDTGRLADVTSLLAGLPAELAAALQPLLATSSTVQGWYQDVLGRDADAGGLDFWSDAANNGATKNDFAAVAQRELAIVAAYQKVLGKRPDQAAIDWLLGSGYQTQGEFEKAIGKVAGLPGYALGGLAGTGLAVVGEAGPEIIDFRQPGRVYRNDELASAIYRGTGSGDGSTALVAEVRELRAAVAKLQTALVQATSDGAAMVATTVAAGAEHVATSVGDAVERGSYEASEREVRKG